MKPNRSRYQSTITAASLRVGDSRIIAGMLLDNETTRTWRHAILEDNVLQMRSTKAALKIAHVLKARLLCMKPALWEMVCTGSHELASQACFAAAVKRSPLLGDYLDLVVREKYKLFAPSLAPTDWSHYIEECRGRDPDMPEWSEKTVLRLRSVVHAMLAQMGYVDDVHTLRLQFVHIARELLQYLKAEQEHYVLRCITVRS